MLFQHYCKCSCATFPEAASFREGCMTKCVSSAYSRNGQSCRAGAWTTNGAKQRERHERLTPRFVSFALFRVYRDPNACLPRGRRVDHERRERWRKTRKCAAAIRVFRTLSRLSWSKCLLATRKSRGPRTARKVAKDAKVCRRDSCLSRSFASIVVQMFACHKEVAWTTNGAKGGERRESVPPRFVSFALFRVYRGPNARSL
jgi:hypothetical protein